MPRNETDVVIAQQYAEEFAQRAQQLGASSLTDLTDLEFANIANAIVRNNLASIYQGALAADGFSIDASMVPGWAARVAATGATPHDAQRFAAGLYPDMAPDEALRRYQRDIARASGATVPEPPSPLFDRPF